MNSAVVLVVSSSMGSHDNVSLKHEVSLPVFLPQSHRSLKPAQLALVWLSQTQLKPAQPSHKHRVEVWGGNTPGATIN